MDSFGLDRISTVPASAAVGGSEPTHFTPWLAKNIGVLGTAIDIDLTVLEAGEEDLVEGQHIEVGVGGYFLDIRATDGAGRTVAIENQYGTSDHKHLGQIITYASGLEAGILVWVAESFTEPHLQAVRWLNERTDSDCGVFAVRARFVRIGDSPVAPAFDVVARPSEWARIQKLLKDNWTESSFLEALIDDVDRAKVERLFELSHASVPIESGDVKAMWFGRRPNGGIYLRPEGRRYGPMYLALNTKGRVVVFGTWRTWLANSNDPGFEPIAGALGQNASESARGVLLGDLDVDVLWVAALDSARRVND
jgi:hypothetical protein